MKTLKINLPEGFQIDSLDKTTGEITLAPIPKDIKERVKTIDDAILILGYDDDDVVNYRKMQSLGLHDHILGNQELVLIVKALNEGWKPDWTNGKYDKWFPWFNMDNACSSSSGRFSFNYSVSWHSHSNVGSRLCFKSSDLAKYAGTQFLEIYRKVYTY